MTNTSLGQIIYSFIEDHLKTQKGLRPLSIRSYRDTLRLFLIFAARDAGRRIARLSLADLTFERVASFLRYLETERRNQIRTRNQRLAALHTFFEYLASRAPEMVVVAERVAAIPIKRTPLNETRFLDHDELATLFAGLPTKGSNASRDRALLLFFYNTGARVQEVADLTVANLDLGPQPRVHLHGKGDKWRSCPLWRRPLLNSGCCSPRERRTILHLPSSCRAPDSRSPGSGFTRSCGVVRKCSGPPGLRQTGGVSLRTFFGTLRQFICWRRASKSTLSAAGSDTPA